MYLAQNQLKINAANEVAVDAFLNTQIKFTQIAQVVEMTLTHITAKNAESIDIVLDADSSSRQYAEHIITENLIGASH